MSRYNRSACSIEEVLVLGLGACSSLGWAPTGWWPVLSICLAVFYSRVVLLHSVRRAAWLGWLYGVAQQVLGQIWVLSAAQQIGMDASMSMLGAMVFASLMGLAVALASALCVAIPLAGRGLLSGAGMRGIVFAGSLVGAEWLRGYLTAGSSQFDVGYAWVDTWLRAYLPLFGVVGTGFIAVLISVMAGGATRVRRPRFVWISAGVIWVFALTGWQLDHHAWTAPTHSLVSFRLLQPNLSSIDKFDATQTMAHLRDLTQQIERRGATIIATPETAIPAFLTDIPSEYTDRWSQFASRSTSHLLIGMPVMGQRSQAHNAMVHVAPNNPDLSVYLKTRLMPFGEFTPSGMSWLTRSWTLPLKDLTPGDPSDVPVHLGQSSVGMMICHEARYGAEGRRWAALAQVIVNPVNLGWFDSTTALAQHLQIVRSRAAEIGRPILLVSNHGGSAYIAANGQIIEQLPLHVKGELTGQVQPTEGLTPYARYGDVLSMSLMVLAAVVAFAFNLMSESPLREGL